MVLKLGSIEPLGDQRTTRSQDSITVYGRGCRIRYGGPRLKRSGNAGLIFRDDIPILLGNIPRNIDTCECNNKITTYELYEVIFDCVIHTMSKIIYSSSLFIISPRKTEYVRVVNCSNEVPGFCMHTKTRNFI